MFNSSLNYFIVLIIVITLMSNNKLNSYNICVIALAATIGLLLLDTIFNQYEGICTDNDPVVCKDGEKYSNICNATEAGRNESDCKKSVKIDKYDIPYLKNIVKLWNNTYNKVQYTLTENDITKIVDEEKITPEEIQTNRTDITESFKELENKLKSGNINDINSILTNINILLENSYRYLTISNTTKSQTESNYIFAFLKRFFKPDIFKKSTGLIKGRTFLKNKVNNVKPDNDKYTVTFYNNSTFIMTRNQYVIYKYNIENIITPNDKYKQSHLDTISLEVYRFIVRHKELLLEPPAAPQPEDGLSTWEIIAIAVGSLVGIVGVIAGIWYYKRKRTNPTTSTQQPQPNNPTQPQLTQQPNPN